MLSQLQCCMWRNHHAILAMQANCAARNAPSSLGARISAIIVLRAMSRAVESESEGFWTWGVGVAENFNDSNSGLTFCSPIVTVCATNVRKRYTTLGNLSSSFQQKMIMAVQKGCSTLTRMPTLRGNSGSAATLWLITQLMLSECNLSRFASLKSPLAFILVDTIVALWR